MGSFFFSFGKRNCGFDVSIYIYKFLWKEDRVFLFYLFCLYFWGKEAHGFFFGFIMFWEIRPWF
jgi:hypothetical protein